MSISTFIGPQRRLCCASGPVDQRATSCRLTSAGAERAICQATARMRSWGRVARTSRSTWPAPAAKPGASMAKYSGW